MFIPVLQKGHDLKIVIDEVGEFFDKYNDDELKYFGTVKYSLSTKRRNFLKSNFAFDLSIFRNTLSYESEALKESFEMQKIPEILDEIKNIMKVIVKG